CYLMKSHGEILYIGKAKNLKNRVRQYFHSPEGHTPKVRAMVERVDDFDILLCRTDFEALTLESNLIKKHRPFYNILLKDDKHYPYLCYDPAEMFPRLTVTRVYNSKDGKKYFGPYIGATAVRQALDELGRYFPLRRCSLKFPLKSPRRPCVYYDTGQCYAPCANRIAEEAYGEILSRSVAFLNGDIRPVLTELRQKMAEAAASMEYEQAAMYRDKIADVETVSEHQLAIQTRSVEQDIVAVAADEIDAVVQLVHIHHGRMEDGQHFLLENQGGDTAAEILSAFIPQYYGEDRMIPREVLLQADIEDAGEMERLLRERRGAAVTLHSPQRGEKRRLVDIAKKNAEDVLVKHQQNKQIRFRRTTQAMRELKDALSLPTLPRRIEGYDISNTQGSLSVGSMVVFEQGAPNKKQYRHFRIKTVEGANDFASMEEVLRRRFTHGLAERKEREEQELPADEGRFSRFPDMILIDGGPQQLAFARRAMRSCGVDLPMFGLAKRNEELFIPNREDPIVLDKRSQGLHLLQRVRDEAHRFGITHHRALRGKAGLKSELSSIAGVGEKRKVALLRAFKSVSAVFAASKDELLAVDGITEAVARAIVNYSHKRKKDG
ncbi:MAG: excinuclease ABC subunit UvrC, partial [Clostridiales bacterium]|nr:excinuclease ABC subunit UvrC [Clostridiales bacterium]